MSKRQARTGGKLEFFSLGLESLGMLWCLLGFRSHGGDDFESRFGGLSRGGRE